MERQGLTRAVVAVVVVVLMVSAGNLLLALVQGNGSEPSPEQDLQPYLTGRIIVKFKGHLAQLPAPTTIQSVINDGLSFFDHTGLPETSSVDELNSLYEVSCARLFPDLPSVQELETRFPIRSGRAPAGAVLPEGLDRVHLLQVGGSGTTVEQALTAYRNDSNVEYAHPDYVVSVQMVPDDPFFNSYGSWGQDYDDLWGLKNIAADQAWDMVEGQGIVVAVVDTGLDYSHPDIQANVWVNADEVPDNQLDDDGNGHVDDVRGWDTTTCGNFDLFADECLEAKPPDNDPFDAHGHGTHVAGTIAAVGNNGIGIIGVAPRVQLMPVKGLSDQGRGLISDLARAVTYAAANGADVINNSWGGGPIAPPPVLREAVDFAHSAGSVIVAASGNSNSDVGNESGGFYPASLSKVISVSAFDQNDEKAFFSNWGESIDVAAPGGGPSQDPNVSFQAQRNILSLLSPDTVIEDLIVADRYHRQAGTSMASPHVAGVAALVLSRQPGLSNDLTRVILRASADDVDAPGFDIYAGHGRVNAYQAVLAADLAAIRPELRIKSLQPATGIIAASSPLAISIEVENIGKADAWDVSLELFDGDPLEGGVRLGRRTVDLPAPSSRVIQQYVTLDELGVHRLYASIDRLNAIPEVHDADNEKLSPVLVSLYQLAERRITSDSRFQFAPDISGNRIVWEDDRNLTPDIYLYDLGTAQEQRITDDPADQRSPAISGSRIVWIDARAGRSEVYLHDLDTGVQRRISSDASVDPQFVDISGDRVVWEDHRSGLGDIYLYDLSTEEEQQITDDASGQRSPAISGDRIVWTDFRNGDGDVYLHDLSTGQEQRITTDPASQRSAAISGERIVWNDLRNGAGDIYLFDLSTGVEQRVSKDSADQSRPAISGDWVVWEDNREGNADIYLYNVASGLEQRINALPTKQWRAAISGDKVVWEDYRNAGGDRSDIYMVAIRDFPRDTTVPHLPIDHGGDHLRFPSPSRTSSGAPRDAATNPVRCVDALFPSRRCDPPTPRPGKR